VLLATPVVLVFVETQQPISAIVEHAEALVAEHVATAFAKRHMRMN
jgi:hypothetical protein